MIPWGLALLSLFAGIAIGVGLVGLFDIPGRADDICEAFREGYRKGVAYDEGKDARSNDDGK